MSTSSARSQHRYRCQGRLPPSLPRLPRCHRQSRRRLRPQRLPSPSSAYEAALGRSSSLGTLLAVSLAESFKHAKQAPIHALAQQLDLVQRVLVTFDRQPLVAFDSGRNRIELVRAKQQVRERVDARHVEQFSGSCALGALIQSDTSMLVPYAYSRFSSGLYAGRDLAVGNLPLVKVHATRCGSPRLYGVSGLVGLRLKVDAPCRPRFCHFCPTS